MRGQSKRKSWAVLAGAAALVALPLSAQATIWTNTSGGDWNVGTNWDAGVPTSAVVAAFSTAGTYTITSSAAGAASSLTVATGVNPTIDFSGQTLTLSGATTVSAASSTIVFGGGTVNAAGTNIFGNGSDSNSITINNSTQFTSAGTTIGRLGGDSNSVTVNGGADATMGALAIGQATSTGTDALTSDGNVLTIDGVGSTLAASDVSVGHINIASGVATNNKLEIKNGADATTSGYLIIGRVQSGSNVQGNSVVVGTAVDGDEATLTVGTTLTIGGSASLGSSNTLTVNAGGRVTVTNGGTTINNRSGNGLSVNGGTFDATGQTITNNRSVSVNNGGLLKAGNFVGAGGSLALNWGTAELASSTFSSSTLTVGDAATGSAYLKLTDAAGVHTFANGLTMNTDGYLQGRGQVVATAGTGQVLVKGSVVPDAGQTLRIDVGSGGFVMDPNSTVSGSGTLQLGAAGTALLKSSGDSANDPVISAAVNLSGATEEVNIAGANDLLNINGAVSNGAINKTGAGTLSLNGANTYDGATTVTEGALRVTHVQGLGSLVADTTVSSGAELRPDIAGSYPELDENLTLSGNGIGATGGVLRVPSASRTPTLTGNITLASDCTFRVDQTSGTLLFGLKIGGGGSGVISGPGGITWTGAGRGVLGVANTYEGTTYVNGTGFRLFVDDAGSLGAATAGTIVADGAGLILRGTSGENMVIAEPITISGMGRADGAIEQNTQVESTNTLTGTLTLAAASNIRVDGTTNWIDVQGQVTGTGGLTKIGSGTLIMNNATNDFTGISYANAGFLRLDADALGATGWANRTVSNGGQVSFTADDVTATFSEDFEIQGTGTGTGALRKRNGSTGGTAILTGRVHLAGSASIGAETSTAVLRLNGQVTGEPGARLTVTRLGTTELTAANTYDGGTTVETGTLKVSHAQALGTGDLNVATGANGVLAAGLSAPVAVAGLTVDGTLDVTDNDMIVHNGDASVITAEVAAGRGDAYSPTWDQAGIVSSVAKDFYDNNYVDLVTVGVVLNSDFENQVFLPQLETFGGETVTSTDVLVKYTYMGDADLTGEVDGSDYQLIDTGYNFALTPMWVTGDFNYDGAIDGSDYQLIDTAYGLQLFGPLGATTAAGVVPEPASLSLVALGAMGLLARRRRN